jgi:hypothetical protein
MLVVVANRRDPEAVALVRRWGAHDAHLLSCVDLSIRGWRHYLDDPAASTAVIDSQVVEFDKIAGVLTLLPCVTVDQLIHIVPADRTYVAAEMMAFLVSWLSELTCPVLNRPTPGCLMGPAWPRERWVHVGVEIGIPVRPLHRRVSLTADPSECIERTAATVTVVGERCFGDTADVLTKHAQRLASVAEVELLAVHFDRPEADGRLLGADLRPDICSPEIADAILVALEESRGC